MTRMEETEALRARTDVHYNCCQSVLVPFADLCGLDKETAFKLGANFGSGMRHGSTCGAVTGALMVLGLAGKGADEATALMRRFREKNQVLDCANLLRLAKERGEERKCHCDRMVYEAVEPLEEHHEGGEKNERGWGVEPRRTVFLWGPFRPEALTPEFLKQVSRVACRPMSMVSQRQLSMVYFSINQPSGRGISSEVPPPQDIAVVERSLR